MTESENTPENGNDEAAQGMPQCKGEGKVAKRSTTREREKERSTQPEKQALAVYFTSSI